MLRFSRVMNVGVIHNNNFRLEFHPLKSKEKATVCKTMADYRGGFECEFVEKPPKAFQSECPVCLLVLRNPYQATCCGYSFCRVCIEKIKARNIACPCCKEDQFDHYPNKGLQRSLNEFKVKCSNKEQGCQWEEELGQLDNHLNYNPPEEKQQEGCQFSKIKCLYCSEIFLRSKIQVHQSDQCQWRPFSCEYCKDYKTTYEDITTNHWPVCGCYPLKCSNKCGQTLERQHLESHISKDCPLTAIDCDFQHVGCEVRLPRKDMPAHLVESVVCHLSLQAAKLKEVEGNVKRLEEENNELKKHVVKLTKHLNIFVCPVDLTLANFEKRKKENAKWRSPPFYTELKGYKLWLGVYPNGHEIFKGQYVSIYLVLMKGEFDHKLKWPFKGNFLIQLLDQYQKEDHCAVIISFYGHAENRVTQGEESTNRYYYRIHPHSTLQPRYLQNDCLKFRIILLGT